MRRSPLGRPGLASGPPTTSKRIDWTKKSKFEVEKDALSVGICGDTKERNSTVEDVFVHAQISALPWLCVGDFNEITFDTEKQGRQQQARRYMEDFRLVLDECELEDLGNVRLISLGVISGMGKLWFMRGWIVLLDHSLESTLS
ncbi:hypothetical protein Dsin_001520 [Dipteronia sinensis]|uniref:Exo_endo_phos domain-containing protein n=1 Tax=Dipteronia sinensis TaxID=43782 RepID=A0AAE0B5S6_9ROSI|nr:hypothetical protein Dsin_001520 [Dipteronia sinensis]